MELKSQFFKILYLYNCYFKNISDNSFVGYRDFRKLFRHSRKKWLILAERVYLKVKKKCITRYGIEFDILLFNKTYQLTFLLPNDKIADI